jgi:hypothetical protein
MHPNLLLVIRNTQMKNGPVQICLPAPPDPHTNGEKKKRGVRRRRIERDFVGAHRQFSNDDLQSIRKSPDKWYTHTTIRILKSAV